jgi:hypothetical protein
MHYDQGRLRTIAAVVFGALMLGVVAYYALLWAPNRELVETAGLEPAEFVEAKAKIYANFLQAVSSIAVLLAGAVAWLSLWWGQRNISDSQRIAVDGQITDRFKNAVDQLGATTSAGKAVEIRLGGIYSLERIARDSANDRKSIVEILSAYVRHNAPLGAPTTKPIPADVQAALTVLGRMFKPEEADWQSPKVWDGPDLSRTDLSGAQLKNAVLPWANLSGTVLTGASLESVVFHHARLANAKLQGVEMDGADLRASNLNRADLTGAYLRGDQTRFRGATLHQTVLTGAYIQGADLSGTTVTQEQIDSASGDYNTVLPEGRKHPSGWQSRPSQPQAQLAPDK